MKTHVLSVGRNDVRWDYMRGSGKGGQHRNKKDTAVRCTHEPSGAVGFAQDERSQPQNRVLAFRRMAESDKFQRWANKEASSDTLRESEIEERVNRMLHPSQLLVEAQEGDRWKVYDGP